MIIDNRGYKLSLNIIDHFIRKKIKRINDSQLCVSNNKCEIRFKSALMSVDIHAI